MPFERTRNNSDQNPQTKRRSFDSEIFDIFVQTQEDFMKLSAADKQTHNIGGMQSMQEMLYNYFVYKHGYDLATEIDTNEFAVYFETLEKKGYKLDEIMDKAGKLHNELKPARDEIIVLNEVMTDLEAFCTGLGATNPALVNLYTDFAAFAHLNPAPNYISNASLIKNVEDSYGVRDNFLQANPGIALSDQQKEDAKHILDQGLEIGDITEKIYIQAVINKISAKLRPPQKAIFDMQFTKLTALGSSYDTLITFKSEWEAFVLAEGPFTAAVQSDLDAIKIDFGDIKKELINRKIANQKSFKKNYSKRDTKFKNMFGKILTYKVFEEALGNKEFYSAAVENIADSFKSFPPYLNQLMKICHYDEGKYATDPEVDGNWTNIKTKRTELEAADISEADKVRLKTEILELEKKMNQRRWTLYAVDVTALNAAIGAIFMKLVENKFDFGVLSDAEKKELMVFLTSSHFENMKDSQVLEYLNLNVADFESFVEELMDLSADELTIPISGGSVDLKFAKDADGKPKKQIMGGGYEQLPKIGDIGGLKDLPMSFTFDASSTNRDFFENSILFDELFYEVEGQKVAESYKVTLLAPDGTTRIGPGYLSAIGPSNNRSGEGNDLFFFTEPLNKLDSNQERKEIHYNGAPVIMKTGDAENKYSLEINDQDKELALTGSQVGQLLLGYTVGKANEARPGMTDQEKDELAGKLGTGFSSFKDTERNNPEGASRDPDEAPEDMAPETAEQQAEDFKKAFKGLKGYNGEFKPGVSFVGRFMDDKYPGDGGRWVEFKVVSDLGGEMEIELSGVSMQLDKEFEGMKQKVPKTKKQLDAWTSAFKKNLFVVGKQKKGKDGFEEQKKAIMDARGSRDRTGLDIFETKIHFDGSHFVLDDQKMGTPGEHIITFASDDLSCEVKHKPNGTFQVDMRFDDFDDKGEERPYKHTENMSYYQFILFLSEKNLLPVSKREKDEKAKLEKAQESANSGGSGPKRKRYKIKHITAFAKNLVSGIKEKNEERLKEEVADLTDWAVGDKGLYRLLSGILPGKLGENFDMMDAEHQEKIEESIKKKIEDWKDRIVKTPDRGDKTWYEIHVKNIIKSGDGTKDRYKTAGAMLAMIEKGGLYQRNEVEPGDWIKIMFGGQAHARFMQLYGDKKKQMDQIYMSVDAPGAMPLLDELTRLEVQFINDILNKGDMGITADEDVNLSYGLSQAKLWSKWFGSELKTSFENATGKSEFEKKFEEIGNVSYEYAESQYQFYVINGAPQLAFPYLQKMYKSTKKRAHRENTAMHVSAAMLSGMFNYGVSLDVKKAFVDMARGNNFTPGILTADAKNSEYLKSLFDMATDGEYTKFMIKNNYTDADLDVLNMKRAGKYIKDFEPWWKSGNGKKILAFLDSENKDFFDKLDSDTTTGLQKKSLKTITDSWNESDTNGIDEGVAKNPANYMNGGILNSSLTMVQNKMDIKNGRFQKDDLQSRLFWQGIKGAINTQNLANEPSRLEYQAKKFFSFFPNIDQRSFVRALATAQAYHKGGDDAQAKDILEYFIKGQMLNHIRSKLPGTFAGTLDVFKDYFWNNIDNFNAGNMKSILDSDAAKDFNNPYIYENMYEYQKVMTTTVGKKDDELRDKKIKRKDSQKYLNPIIDDIDKSLRRNNLVSSLDLKSDAMKGDAPGGRGSSSPTAPGVNSSGVASFGTGVDGSAGDI